MTTFWEDWKTSRREKGGAVASKQAQRNRPRPPAVPEGVGGGGRGPRQENRRGTRGSVLPAVDSKAQAFTSRGIQELPGLVTPRLARDLPRLSAVTPAFRFAFPLFPPSLLSPPTCFPPSPPSGIHSCLRYPCLSPSFLSSLRGFCVFSPPPFFLFECLSHSPFFPPSLPRAFLPVLYPPHVPFHQLSLLFHSLPSFVFVPLLSRRPSGGRAEI